MTVSLQKACHDLLKFYTLVEHTSYIMGLDKEFSGPQASADLFSYTEGIRGALVVDHTTLLQLWNRLTDSLRKVALDQTPIPRGLVHSAYLLAAYTWYQLKLTTDPVGQLEAKSQRVTVHPPEMITSLVGMAEMKSVGIEALVERGL